MNMKISLNKLQTSSEAVISTVSLSFIAKALAFSQSIVVTYIFGTQMSTDITFYLVSVVAMITILVNALDEGVFIPLILKIRNSVSEDESKKLISFLYMIYLSAGGGLAVIMTVFPVEILSFFSKFSAGSIRENIVIVRCIAPTILLSVINIFVLDVLVSYRRFTLTVLLDIVKSLITLLFVICFKDLLEVRSLAAGVLGASLLQFFIVNVIMQVQLKCKVRPGTYGIDKQTVRNLMYILAANISTFLYGFICMYLLSGFEEGVYSAVSYSEKLYASINTIFTCQISTVIGISIIDLYITKNYAKLNDIFVKYLKAGFFIITPVCFILSLNSSTVISILFGRGEFTRESVSMTAGFFTYFVLAIPIRLVYSLIERLMIAKQIQKSVFYWQVFESILGIIITGAFIVKLGYKGYAVGTLLSLLVYMVLFTFFILKKEFDFISRSEIITFLVSNITINIAISAFVYIVLKGFNTGNRLDLKILVLTLSTAAYMLLYLFLSCFSKSNREIMRGLFLNVKGLVRNE